MMSTSGYGTFLDSVGAEKTELKSIVDQAAGVDEVLYVCQPASC